MSSLYPGDFCDDAITGRGFVDDFCIVALGDNVCGILEGDDTVRKKPVILFKNNYISETKILEKCFPAKQFIRKRKQRLHAVADDLEGECLFFIQAFLKKRNN